MRDCRGRDSRTLNQAKSFGCEVVDITKGSVDEQIEKILGTSEVDAAVDCVGFEARGCGHNHAKEVPAQVLNDCMTGTNAGARLEFPVCTLRKTRERWKMPRKPET